MKLSMWMIANRLSPLLDIKTEIRENAEPVLNSARIAYSTNCVHIYPEADHVVCNGEGDRILIYNIGMKECFEIIQGIFDFFQDWEETAEKYIRCEKFQELIDSCWILFQNPMVLADANLKILAMTREEKCGEMDKEWNYMRKYGFTSVNSVRSMDYRITNIDFSHYGCQIYHFDNNNQMKFGGASYNMSFHNIACGRFTLLAKNRALNPGDYQLIKRLCEMLEPVLGSLDTRFLPTTQVFTSLFLNQPYSEEELDYQLDLYGWKREDTFQVCGILCGKPDTGTSSIDLIMRTLQVQPLGYSAVRMDPYIFLLANRELSTDTVFLHFLDGLVASSSSAAGFSLPLKDLSSAPQLMEQAKKAVYYGLMLDRNHSVYEFRRYAADYILESTDSTGKQKACHPVVTELFQSKTKNRDPLYDTLRAYLANERSTLKTAGALFTHKNTVHYRIQKIRELLGDDLEEPETRYYIMTSIRYLDLQEIRKKFSSRH